MVHGEQVGCLLVPVAVAGRTDLALPSLLLYLAGYTITNLGGLRRYHRPTRPPQTGLIPGLAKVHLWLAASLVVTLLGLVGTPPTVVFVGKLTTAAAWDGGCAWLAVVVFANTLGSLFYYLALDRAVPRVRAGRTNQYQRRHR